MEDGMEEINNKPKMSHEERMALAAKLDADLDGFINSLEKRRTTEEFDSAKLERVS